MTTLAGRSADHAVWLLPSNAFAGLDSVEECRPEKNVKVFPHGGLVAARDSWERSAGHLTADFGRHGSLSFGHSHADALSVELHAGGGPLFVDSGTFTYMGPERNAFRATCAHNTMEVDGVGSSIPATPFRWESAAHGALREWEMKGDAAWFTGIHEGYHRLTSPVTHRRSIFHPVRGVWVFEDAAEGNGEHDVRLPWHCHQDVHPKLAESGSHLAQFALWRAQQHVVTAAVLSTSAGEANIEPHWVSPQFGRRERSSSCIWLARQARDARILTVVIDWTVFTGNQVLVSAGNRSVILNPPSPREGDCTLTWNTHNSTDDAPRLTWAQTDGEVLVAAGPGLWVARPRLHQEDRR